MSEPYIRLYAADMRADPKLRGLSADLRYALIQAWDLAKNGPGAVDELRASDGRAMRERELRDLSNVSPSATRRMFERWSDLGLCEYDGELVRFPSLASRQGIDRTAADRMRRYRERKRYGSVTPKVTGQRYGPVTGENQNQKKEHKPTPLPQPVTPSSTPRKPDPIWDALAEVCGQPTEPMPKAERGRWNQAAKQLRDINIEPRDVVAVGNHLKQRWGDRVKLTPTAIIGNWSSTLGELQGNGHHRRQLTREDLERMKAEQAAVTAQAHHEHEEMPY